MIILYFYLPLRISHRAEGPGREILKRPSVYPSITFSFCTVTQKRIAVFSRNFASYLHHAMGESNLFLENQFFLI